MRANSINSQTAQQGPPEVTPSMKENDARPSALAWPVLIVQLSFLYWFSTLIDPWYLSLLLVPLYFKLKQLLFKHVYGLEELTTMDYFFLYDNYKNRANILCVSIWHKFDNARVRA